MEINDLTHTIIGGAYKVHNVLGFGFLERVYENALRIELEKLGIRVLQKQNSTSGMTIRLSAITFPIFGFLKN